MVDIIYATQPIKDKGGRTVLNPLHFLAPVKDAKTVFVQDGFPEVTEAYGRVDGVTVKPLTELPQKSVASAAGTGNKEK